jgi:outer membrane protein
MKKQGLILLLLILSVLTMNGQELLTLEKAIELGLANNYGINIAKENLKITKNNAVPGNAGMLPSIDASAGYLHGLSDAKVRTATGSELDNAAARSDLLNAGINLNWTLFDGLKMFITYDKLRKLEETGELNLKIEVENTLAKIIAAYYDIIRQSRVLSIIREQVEISKFRLDLARLRYETGSGSEMEYLKAKVELNADISGLSNEQTVFLNSKTTLNDILARDVTITFNVQDTILINDTLLYDSLRQRMREANRNLLLAGKSKEISLLEMKETRASQWPKIDFYTGFNYLHSQTEANFVSYNRNFGPGIGVTANVSIFDGLNLRRQYRNAKVNFDITGLEKQKLESRLETYLLKIYNDYRNEIEMIGFEKENLILAQKNMDIAKESYAVGSISSIQLREIQIDLLDAGTRLITAEFKAKLTETGLLLISGNLIH